ncbi:hypothetical protein [Candidatus Accumulibacter sp. ACC012]|uniref:hypothetical protein n=1 Tax=Candidatus Accumulibacter sp. ACC012 TaxID=2823332 RepID=UPI0025B858A8|nr:hypothetical protein [Candidatus Accumulibacter sp. ACC012]
MLVVVTWDWSDLVLDETDPVAVQILRDTGGGASVVHRSGQRTGTYTDSAGQAGASYAIELISAKADAPGGMNQCRSGGRASVVTPLSEVGSPHETVLRLARLWSGF